MDSDIRPITDFAEMVALERLQQEIWQLPDKREVTPAHLLITFQKNGGLLLGAYVDGLLVGFSLAFLGETGDGRRKLCSEMLGVLPAYRDQKLGERLKWAQRAHALARGIELITWTYDPLETRNGRLNLHKLGAVCNTYFENLYGDMDGDNAGMPSDRLQVDWWVRSPRVEERRQVAPATSLPAYQSQAVPVLNLPPPDSLAPPSLRALPESDGLLLAVPADIQALKQRDMALALAWRRHTRAWFQQLFTAGYLAQDLLLDHNLCFYFLQREGG